MPYSITTKDGITLQGIPDDVSPDSPELKARVTAIRGGNPAALNPAERPSIGRQLLDTGKAALLGAQDAATFGLGDEISAGLQTAGQALTGGLDGRTLGTAFEQNRAAVEQANRAGMDQAPIAAFSGAVAPALALPGGPMQQGGNLAIRMLQGGTIAGLSGAAAGAGSAQPGARVAGATMGGGVAGALGTVLPGGGAAVNRIAQGLGVDATGAARNRLLAALQRDEMTGADLVRAGETAASWNPQARLAHQAGPNVQGLIESAAQTPGRAQKVIESTMVALQKGQRERLSATIANLTGSQKTAMRALDDTAAIRAQQSGPLYAQAYQHAPSSVLTVAFEEATSRGWGQSILRSPELRKNLQTEFGVDDIASAPPMVLIDAWKRTAQELSDQAAAKGNNNTARIITDMKNGVIDLAKAENKAYAEALDSWGGKAQYMALVERGQNLLSKSQTAEQLKADIAKMSQADLEALRIGAASALKAKIGNDPSKLGDMTKYFRSPEVRAKIDAILPDDKRREKWAKVFGFEEAQSALTGKALAGSATYRRMAQEADADDLISDLVLSAAKGSPTPGIWAGLIGKGAKAARNRVQKESNAVIADALMAKPSDSNKLYSLLQKPKPRNNLAPLLVTGQQSGGQ